MRVSLTSVLAAALQPTSAQPGGGEGLLPLAQLGRGGGQVVTAGARRPGHLQLVGSQLVNMSNERALETPPVGCVLLVHNHDNVVVVHHALLGCLLAEGSCGPGAGARSVTSLLPLLVCSCTEIRSG